MSDVFDQASDLEQWQRDAALAEQAARAPQVEAADWETASAKWCGGESCGERIPDERRRAYPGVKFCVECQMRAEKEERRRR